MMVKKKFLIDTSITDFGPLLRGPEYLFKGLKETGVDGIELVVGIKSRWSVGLYKSLSQKYNLPIISLHQPPWAGLGLTFDEGFLKIARELSVKYVVFHPIPRADFRGKRGRKYLQWLSRMQKEEGITVLLENLAPKYNDPITSSLFPLHKSASDLDELLQAVEEFNLKLTLDIDHLKLKAPQEEAWFEKIFPRIGNIHLCSFNKDKIHLPIYLGDFQSKEFVHYLQEKNYTGLITFEIYYPGLLSFLRYDFDVIKKSVELFKSF